MMNFDWLLHDKDILIEFNSSSRSTARLRRQLFSWIMASAYRVIRFLISVEILKLLRSPYCLKRRILSTDKRVND